MSSVNNAWRKVKVNQIRRRPYQRDRFLVVRVFKDPRYHFPRCELRRLKDGQTFIRSTTTVGGWWCS